jgi:hypothetical protein
LRDGVIVVLPDTAGEVAVLLGAAGALARYFHQIMTEHVKFIWYQLPMIMFIGGFLGYMGAEIATAYGMTTQWAGIIAGTIGASGAYGFDFLMMVMSKARSK